MPSADVVVCCASIRRVTILTTSHMIDIFLNALFAWLFGMTARYALPRGYYSLRGGYSLIALHAKEPDARTNVERRQAINQGTLFLLGGLGWLLAGLFSAGLTVFFVVQVLVFSIPR